jgi:hypothetical protein
MLDELVDPPRPKQPPIPALMPMLATTLPARPFPTRTWRRRRRILRRRQRRVSRTPVQTTLELGYPSLEPLIRLNQTSVRLDQLIKPKQQTDSRLAIAIQDPFRLNPLHTTRFAAQARVPTPAERLRKHGYLQDFLS